MAARAHSTEELFREYLWSCAIAFALMVVLGGISMIPSISLVGILLAPGMLLAAVLFPTGGHSDAVLVYGAVAVLLDSLLYGCLILWVRRMIKRNKGRTE